MSYEEWVDGYALETTFKDGTTIDGAGDTAYLIGALSQESDMPSPTTEMVDVPLGVSAREPTAGTPVKGKFRCHGMLGFAVQNGIPIYLAMGLSSTAGTYTHTITPTTDGSLLPSFAWQHEEKGASITNEEYQFQGVKVDSLLLSHDAAGPNILMAKLEIKAAYALDPAFALTNKPALPPTANTQHYSALTRTWDLGGTPLSIDGLSKIEIAIINTLTEQYAHSYDSGVYTGRWPYAFTEGKKKMYQIDLWMAKTTIERRMWDELIAASNLKECYFKWTRSTNDYIAVTASDCGVVVHQLKTPADNKDMVRVTLTPRALSFEVKDSIAGGYYGE
jgi:hypothetical protein